MADLATALRARLIGAAPVAAIVGTKVYWNRVSQTASLPYVRLQVISDPRSTHLKGRTAARQTRVQVDCMSLSHVEAFDLAEKVIAAIEPPATQSGVQFGFTESEGPRDLGEDVEGVGFVHRAMVDLIAEHKMV